MGFELLPGKRTASFALLGLLLIISLTITSTVEGQSLNDEEITEKLIVASSEFVDTVSDGVDGDPQEQDSTPTPDPLDEPGDEEDAGDSEGEEETEIPTEEPSADADADGDDSEEGTDGEDSEDCGSDDEDDSKGEDSEDGSDGEDSEDGGSDDEDDSEGEGSEDGSDEEDSDDSGSDDGEDSEGEDSEDGSDGEDSEDSGSDEEDDSEGEDSEDGSDGEDSEGSDSDEDDVDTTVSSASLDVALDDISIDVTCITTNGVTKHKWTVNNIGSFKVRFNWSSSSGEYENSLTTLNPGQSSSSFYTNASAQTLTVLYQYQESGNWSSTYTETKSHESCDVVDLSLAITNVDSTCTGVEVTVEVSNPSTSLDATNVVVEFDISNVTEYVNQYTSKQTIDVSKSSSSQLTFTIVTNDDWISATSSDYIDFTASITSADQSDSNSGNNSASDKAYNPGNCIQTPTVATTCEVHEGVLQHKITITNPNDFDIYIKLTGQSDFDQLGSGQSTVFYTDHTAQTVTLQYKKSGGDVYSKNIEMGNCLVAPTLSVECGYNGSEYAHVWTLTNPNAVSLNYYWAGSSTPSNGSGTVNASGTVEIYTKLDAQSMLISYNYDGVTYTLTIQEAESCLVDLDLSYECQSDGQHKWVVKNNNVQTSVEFNIWTDPDVGSGDSITLYAGDSKSIYTESSAHTAYVSYTYAGETHTTSLYGDYCPQHLDLEYECTDSEQHEWTVTNPNTISVNFDWWTDPDAGSGGPITLGAGETTTFTTQNIAHDTYARFEYGSTTYITYRTAEVCLVQLEIDYDCHEYNGSHIWTVTNPNAFEIEFTWATEDGTQSGGPLTVAAGPGTTETFTTDSTAHKVIVSYEHNGKNKSVEKEAETCKSSDLTLTYLCGYASDDDLYWSITNPYSVDLDVDWEVSGSSSESGTVTALASSDTIFTTSKGNKTVIISVDGYQVGQDDGGEACRVELTLDYQCLDSGKHKWTVTNPNSSDQSFTWSATNGQSGSGTAPANSTTTFKTGSSAHTVTLTYQTDPSPEKTTSVIAEACKASTDDEEEEEEETTVVTTQTSTSLTESEESTYTDWIVFHSLRDGNLEIYRLDGVEGEEGYQLINLSQSSATDSNPSRSFDNEWVAFQSNRDGNYEIYVTDSLGSEQIRLTDNSANDINPMFSPDNTNIIFQSDRNGSWDLYMINRTTGEEVQLTDSDADETNPFFPSENENFLVYESNQNGNQDIFLLNIVTNNEYHITNGAEDEVSPVLSPSGLKVAYLSPVDGVWNLFIVGIDGSNMIQITDGDGDTDNPAWSPDGTKIAYQSERDGNIDIYVYDLEESIEYRLTDNAGPDTAPSWDSSGTYISYTTKEKDWQTSDIYQVFWQGGESSCLTNHISTDKWSD